MREVGLWKEPRENASSYDLTQLAASVVMLSKTIPFAYFIFFQLVDSAW